jgi:hypothetical protein
LSHTLLFIPIVGKIYEFGCWRMEDIEITVGVLRKYAKYCKNVFDIFYGVLVPKGS